MQNRTLRNTNRISTESNSAGKNLNISAGGAPPVRRSCQNSVNKKLVKYDSDDIIIPIPTDSDGSAYDAIINPNGMNGTERFFSIPKDSNTTAGALHKYLENFLGRNICAALWTNGSNKIEKCGILTEVGSDYISIKDKKSKRLIIMNMDKVKYISVFCV